MISMNKPQWDCIVVGAGMSGLCCASRLAQKGHRVLVLEARHRIGGRIHTVFSPDKGALDLGASFVHGVDGNPLTQMAKESNVKLYEGILDGLVFKPDGSLLSEEVSGKITDKVFTTLFDTAREHSRHNVVSPTKSLESYVTAPGSPLYEGLDKEERDYATTMSQLLDGWTGASLDKISFKYWGFEREFEGSDKVVADGYIHLLKPVQEVFIKAGGKLLLSTPVSSLVYDEDAGLVRVTDSSGVTYSAKSTVCTVPLGVLKHNPPVFDPPLPSRRLDAITKVGFGLLNKVIMTYPSLWWPKDTTSIHVFLPPASFTAEPVEGEPMPSEGAAAEDLLPPGLASRALFAQSYYPLTGRPLLMFFFGGAHGEALERLSDEQIKTWVHAALARCLLRLPGAPASAPDPLDCTVTRWASDPLAFGSYAYTSVANAEALVRGDEPPSPLHMVELSRPLWDTRLGFAGEHTELDHYASAHGSAISGWREAERVHTALEGPWAELRKEC